MRIVSGEWRGRTLSAPATNEYRPTQARVREALFSALGGRLSAALVVDLYAGSGALGLEALSRGAAAAVFVEHSAAARAVLRENVARCGAAERVQIFGVDVGRFLAGECGHFRDIGLVLADPPYAEDASGLLLAIVASPALEWCAGAGIAVEHACRGGTLQLPAGWRSGPPRRYGESCVTIAERECDE